ncbi:heterokaryon incompatibility protein-domain-containing protein [Aspergillus novoparasiticus]|uniref:Heterokaryon incompatibility protein-domain-containing protein n=1 Tax=Aspergillus novoparasiticus TaxID=986946 RepID=A0A5N6F033_9EURO|nr:heterokaryon incompatibility protein-domain-containing protein [Aspergillus novoparasiticus]
MNPFRYSPLPTQPGSIRLLCLKPSIHKDAQIECELYYYHLEVREDERMISHSYEALSYLWGDRSVEHSIIVNGHTFRVWENLHAALVQLRNHRWNRILWIDALCINQADDEEKSRQIPFMRQIYARANGVVVWLGVEGEGSSQAYGCIQFAAAQSTTSWVGIQMSLSKQQQDACMALLRREWFERIWVLQEVGMARDIQIMCGNERMNGFTFCTGLANLALDFEDCTGLKTLISSITYLIRGAIHRPRHTIDVGCLSIGQLVDMYHDRKASIPHDRVYGLLGLSSEPRPETLISGYQIDWPLFLEKFMRYVLTENVSVETWDKDDLAVITASGIVLGNVESVIFNDLKTQAHRQFLNITFTECMLPKGSGRRGATNPVLWILPISAKPIEKGDMVFLFQGCRKPSIIRAYRDHVSIIMLDAWPMATDLELETPDKRPSLFKEKYPSFYAVWDGRISSSSLNQRGENSNPALCLNDILPKYPSTPEERTMRLGGMAEVMVDAGRLDEAAKRCQEIILLNEKSLGSEHRDVRQTISHLGAIYMEQESCGLPEEPTRRCRECVLEGIQQGAAIPEEEMERCISLFGPKTLSFLIDQRASAVLGSQGVLETVAGHEDHADRMINIVLDRCQNGAWTSAVMLPVAIVTKVCTEATIMRLLDHRDCQYPISQHLLLRAAAKRGRRVYAALRGVYRKENGIDISPEEQATIEAAIRQFRHDELRIEGVVLRQTR